MIRPIRSAPWRWWPKGDARPARRCSVSTSHRRAKPARPSSRRSCGMRHSSSPTRRRNSTRNRPPHSPCGRSIRRPPSRPRAQVDTPRVDVDMLAGFYVEVKLWCRRIFERWVVGSARPVIQYVNRHEVDLIDRSGLRPSIEGPPTPCNWCHESQ